MIPSGYINQFSQSAPWLGSIEGINALKGLARMRPESMMKAMNVIGTPPSSSNEYVSFLPQDLARFFSAETRTDRDIVATKALPVVDAFSTQFAMAIQTSYGDTRFITNFQSETGLSASRTGIARPDTVNLKQHSDRRTISATAQQVGLVGGIGPMGVPMVSRNGLGKVLWESIKGKSLAYERDLFHADSGVNALEFDSIPIQIFDNGTEDLNWFDLRGALMTWEALFTAIAQLSGSKFSATTQAIWLTSDTWASLMIEANDSGRWDRSIDGQPAPSGQGWVYNPTRAGLVGPKGQFIPLVVAPMLKGPTDYPYTLNAAVQGTPAQQVTIANQTSAAAGGSGSQFTAADAGDYIYGVVAVFLDGASVGYSTAAITVTAGQEVTITMDDAAIGTADNPLYAYELWRSDKDAAATTFKFIKRYPPKNATVTVMVDDNSTIPGTDVALALQWSEGGINVPTLLKPVRFPLPTTTMVATQHVVLSIQAPKVWHYNRQIAFKNVGRPAVVS